MSSARRLGSTAAVNVQLAASPTMLAIPSEASVSPMPSPINAAGGAGAHEMREEDDSNNPLSPKVGTRALKRVSPRVEVAAADSDEEDSKQREANEKNKKEVLAQEEEFRREAAKRNPFMQQVADEQRFCPKLKCAIL